MTHKKGQRFVNKDGSVVVEIVRTSRIPSCGDRYCSMCNKVASYTVKSIQNKKRSSDWKKASTSVMNANKLKSWSYLVGQDAPSK